MAKFELKIYNMDTEEVEKTYQRNFIPVSLYLKFQQYSEKVVGNKIKSDLDFFTELKDLFLETFYGLTEEEYLTKTDVAAVLKMFSTICSKATQFDSSKNA